MSEFFVPSQPRVREDPFSSGVVQNNLEFFMQFFEKGLNDGDILVWDQVLGRYLAKPAGAVEIVTALPAAPYPGQTVLLVDSLSNPSFHWNLRYNADSVSAYKWECIGGTPALANVYTYNETAATYYTDLASIGPDIQIPAGIGGDFMVTVGAWIWHDILNNYAYMSPSFIGQAGGSDTWAAIGSFSSPTAAIRSSRVNGLWGGRLIRAVYRSSTGSYSARFSNRWMTVVPYRVG